MRTHIRCIYRCMWEKWPVMRSLSGTPFHSSPAKSYYLNVIRMAAREHDWYMNKFPKHAWPFKAACIVNFDVMLCYIFRRWVANFFFGNNLILWRVCILIGSMHNFRKCYHILKAIIFIKIIAHILERFLSLKYFSLNLKFPFQCYVDCLPIDNKSCITVHFCVNLWKPFFADCMYIWWIWKCMHQCNRRFK